MTGLRQSALQKAVYEKLIGDLPLMAVVSAVFDAPPQSAIFPYITIGDATTSEFSNLKESGADYKLNIHIWSREAGHKQTADIMELIYGLLHNGNVTITGQTLVAMRVISSSVTLENDGVTYHGLLRLQVVLVG